MPLRQLLLASLIVLASGVRAEATTYTVKAGGGGNFATISACAATAVPGDTCQIFAGSYPGWTQSVSGSAGSLITFVANGQTFPTCALTSCSGPNGDIVTITSSVSISGQSYVAITGLTFSSATISGSNTTSHNTISYNKFIGPPSSPAFNISDGQGSTGSDNYIGYNVVAWSGTGQANAFYVYGDRNVFEHNDATGYGDDFLDAGGTNLIIRYNYAHDIDGATSGQAQHMDFLQEIGGNTTPVISFSLVEGNVLRNCMNDGGNCHGLAIIRNGTSTGADTIILRFNYADNYDGDCVNWGGVGDNVPNGSMYNNTCGARSSLASYNLSCDSTQGNTPNILIFNNICYNETQGGHYPFGGTATSPWPNGEDGNLVFTPGYSGSWPSPYSAEATYTLLANKDPQFANYPLDATLKATSPAIGAGVNGTSASSSGSNSTSLTVGNAHVFQPGWAGVNGDCVRVGALVTSPTACITAINYSTNTLTISPAMSWNSGDPVYVYKDSGGNIRLNGLKPDIGASPSTQSQAQKPAAPTNLQVVVQ